MGFFSKKQLSDGDRKQQSMSGPFIADDRTMARVAELMKMFNDAADNGTLVHATGKGISSAAGLHSGEQLLQEPLRDIPAEVLFERPWKMLAAVAHCAAQNGDHVLAARVFFFTVFWGTSIAPRLDRGDLFDVLLTKSPPTIEVEIATVAFGSLQELSDDQTIFTSAKESVTVGKLARIAANVLVHAPEKGIPVDNVVMFEALVRLGAGKIS